jgi:antitoxin MazE
MRTRVQKWGNSLALRIPRPFAEEAHIQENSTVDVSVKAGKLVVIPMEPKQSLDALIEQITDENRHAEIATGRNVGNEVW